MLWNTAAEPRKNATGLKQVHVYRILPIAEEIPATTFIMMYARTAENPDRSEQLLRVLSPAMMEYVLHPRVNTPQMRLDTNVDFSRFCSNRFS